MKRMMGVLTLLSLYCFSPSGVTAYAEETGAAVDWTKNEQLMHDSLKEARPLASEAEIEEVMGHTLLSANNQWQRAEIHLKRALQLDPKRCMAAYDLGLINVDTPEGIKYFKRAVEANASFPAPYYWIGYNSVKAGHDKDAIFYFEKYLQVAKSTEETDRIVTAKGVLEELRADKTGSEVAKIRSPGGVTESDS